MCGSLFVLFMCVSVRSFLCVHACMRVIVCVRDLVCFSVCACCDCVCDLRFVFFLSVMCVGVRCMCLLCCGCACLRIFSYVCIFVLYLCDWSPGRCLSLFLWVVIVCVVVV